MSFDDQLIDAIKYFTGDRDSEMHSASLTGDRDSDMHSASHEIWQQTRIHIHFDEIQNFCIKHDL